MTRSTIALGAIAALTCAASADTLTETASITSDGQMFVFEFDMVGMSAGEGTLTIDALGDYSIVPPSSEVLSWDVDGVASGEGFAAEAFMGSVDLFQNLVSQTWTISAGDMAAITADGMVTITLSNALAVNANNPNEDYITATLSYPIPAPSAMALLGLGGLAAARRRR
jgi:hypothetical protein